jgi:glycosyltransferase involved in cell wall biosynthesis
VRYLTFRARISDVRRARVILTGFFVAAEATPLPVSVVIPAYNRPELVGRAVRSALAQRPRPPAEVVVVDDCSSDDTGAVARAAGARVIRHEENRGEGGARNTAIQAAREDWVAMLDSDDEWLPDHLAALWPHAEGRVILGSTAVATGAGEEQLWGRERATPRVLRSPADLLAGGNALVNSSVLARRDAVLAAGLFRADLERGADLDLWLRVLEHGEGYVSPAVTVVYRLHEGQVSDDRGAMWEAHRAIVDAYRDRPWCGSGVRRGSEGILRWDQLRDALAHRRRGDALGHLGAIARDPHKAAAVARLLTSRALLRQRSRRYRRARHTAPAGGRWRVERGGR